MTLEEILARLSDLDNAQVNVEFDPENIAGELNEKVDAIKIVLDRLQGESARLRVCAEEFARAAKTVENNAERLKEYVLYAMQQNGFEKLPGKLWRLQVQKAAPALVTEYSPTAETMLEMPSFVERKVGYSWNKEQIKEHLKAGGEFRYGSLRDSYYVRSYVNKGGAKDE